MTIGPAPMIRMVEMWVRFGIRSRWQEIGHKKRARYRASLKPRARVALARGVVFRPDSAAAKPRKGAHQPAISDSFGYSCHPRNLCENPKALAEVGRFDIAAIQMIFCFHSL